MATKGHKVSSVHDENVSKFNAVTVAQFCEYLKLYTKWVNFVACEVYLNKTVLFRRGK